MDKPNTRLLIIKNNPIATRGEESGKMGGTGMRRKGALVMGTGCDTEVLNTLYHTSETNRTRYINYNGIFKNSTRSQDFF